MVFQILVTIRHLLSQSKPFAIQKQIFYLTNKTVIVPAAPASQWEICISAFEIIEPGISFGVEAGGGYGVRKDPKRKSTCNSFHGEPNLDNTPHSFCIFCNNTLLNKKRAQGNARDFGPRLVPHALRESS